MRTNGLVARAIIKPRGVSTTTFKEVKQMNGFISGINKNGKQTVKNGYKTEGFATNVASLGNVAFVLGMCEPNKVAKAKLIAHSQDINARGTLLTVLSTDGKKAMPISFKFNAPMTSKYTSRGYGLFAKETITFSKDVKEMLAKNHITEADAKIQLISQIMLHEIVLASSVPESMVLRFSTYQNAGVNENQPLFDAVEKACIKATGEINVEKMTELTKMIVAHDKAGLTKALGASATKLLA